MILQALQGLQNFSDIGRPISKIGCYFDYLIIWCTYTIIYKKKLQAIYLMLYKRWYKTAKIKKYKHERVLAYTFNLSSVGLARINV